VARGLDDPGSAEVDAKTRLQVPKGGDASAVEDDDVKYVVRKGPPVDGFVRRGNEILKAKGCPVVEEHLSQTLLHEPLDRDGGRGPWQPQVTYEASVRLKGAPYIARDAFLNGDEKAFYYGTERRLNDSTAAPWTRQADGTLKASGAEGEWALALAGNWDWDYVRVSTTLDSADATAGIAVGIDEVIGSPQGLAAVIETSGGKRTLAIYHLNGGTRALLPRPEKEPVDLGAKVTLTVTVFDDVVRVVAEGKAAGGQGARVEELREVPRQTVRNGRIALVSGGAPVFSSLRVEGLELYRFRFTASRYASFKEHIQSIYGGADATKPLELPRLDPAKDLGVEPVTIGVDVLTDAEVTAIDALETTEERQALFAATLTKLGAPLRQRCDRLSLTRVVDSKGKPVLLLESPEPIVFKAEVQLTVEQEGGAAVPVRVLRNATSTAAIIVAPETPLGDKPLKLTFSLSRERWPTTGGESAARYAEKASIVVT
jgi:hypothetical protein